ncbi:MAG: transposase [Gemmatimonadaceae bacterium]|nr:transposase [Gemmatimonadaceae bacterium]
MIKADRCGLAAADAGVRSMRGADWQRAASGASTGIQHQRIHPGRPQQNGAHERMHRTLKRQAIKPVARTCAAQQKSFDVFRAEFNTL